MALGGGTWLFQNKVLPGTYINFVSKVRAEAEIADRGYGTMALELDWGPSDQIFRVEADEFQTECQKIFGYDYGSDKLAGLRDLFLNLKTGYFYRLNGGGAKATCTLGTAKYAGTRGNDISIGAQDDPDTDGNKVVYTYLTTDGVLKTVDKQSVKTSAELVDNDYVVFEKTGELAVAAAVKMAGGTNGETVTTADYQKYLDLIEPYYFNVMGYVGSDTEVQSLLLAFVKRLRDDEGSKFQVVLFGADKPNYEGVININKANEVTDSGKEKGSLAYWVTGAEASCAINADLTNTIYNGEFTVKTQLKQYELKQAINDGLLTFHVVTDPVDGDVTGDVRVLEDINSFTEFTKTKNSDFALNQVIRVLDNTAIDLAHAFNKVYLGKAQNNNDGRDALWADGCYILEQYQKVGAITGFVESDLAKPVQGDDKSSVVWTFQEQPVVSMKKLYATVVVA